MDARLPFATGADRVRLLYQLPLTGHETRLLVLGDSADAQATFGASRRGMEMDFVQPGVALQRLAESAYDAVALPGTLLHTMPPAELLRLAYKALRPGGTVVGHLDQVLSLHVLLRLLRRRAALPPWGHLQGFTSARGCCVALAQCGFDVPECYYVEPRIQEPMALVPTDARAARSHFLRSIRRSRPLYTAPGYALRMTLAALGLGGALQPHLFFWARRPC